MVNVSNKKDKKVTTLLKAAEKHDSKLHGFHIVAIGASAGGLEALEQFFAHVPKDNGMAFVIIQHLDPNHKGILPELLQRTTLMKVLQVSDQMEVKPDHVFVIPPNKSMSILNGHLHLFEATEVRGLRLPIDVFFRSLADDQKEKSIGIILSGMGSDGSLGLKAIKEKGGTVLVQEPLSSKFNGMPSSAIEAIPADIIASAEDLPTKLIAYLNYNHPISKKILIEDKNKTNLEKIVILIRAQTGHDFSYYKKNTLYRRIERRMNIHQLDKINNYVRLLQDNPNELEILFKELLIGVTNFFRDTYVWEKLKEQILPDLFNGLPNGYLLRVWIPGCSTGEEAYSFAIIFKETYEKVIKSKNITLQIFATDISNDSIELARKGVYSSNIVANVSPERISRFFTVNESAYTINTSIREMVVFAPHSVIKDPPFNKLDFLFCRNLLIYLESELQKKLMKMFYFSLNPGGFMILGTAENIHSEEILFSTYDSKLKIYKRTISSKEIERMVFSDTITPSIKRVQENITVFKTANTIQNFADQLILQQFAPASVLINPDGDILYITGRTGKYLEPAAGKANMNIHAMAREGIRSELLSAVRKAKQTSELVHLKNIRVENNGVSQLVNITIQRTEKPEEFSGTIMIVFTDVIGLSKHISKKSTVGKQIFTSREDEHELHRTREELQSTREEMQTSQEELKSTNEELQSTNEELQSTNEELTTSKEEMQSLNEELHTVNNELQSKVTDLMAVNNDMTNLLNSTDIATLFLDRELNIRRFTDQITNIIKLRQTDIGRPFTEMVSDLNYPEIADHSREVLKTLIFRESDISAHNNKWFKVRIMPYRTLDDRIDGLVVTFIDISVAKNLEAELKRNSKNSS
jgi:two-component system CheB/CheR fusion protein